MAAPVRTDEIFEAVAAVLQPDPAIRQQAEQYVNEAYKRPQCALALLSIIGATHIDAGVHYSGFWLVASSFAPRSRGVADASLSAGNSQNVSRTLTVAFMI